MYKCLWLIWNVVQNFAVSVVAFLVIYPKITEMHITCCLTDLYNLVVLSVDQASVQLGACHSLFDPQLDMGQTSSHLEFDWQRGPFQAYCCGCWGPKPFLAFGCWGQVLSTQVSWSYFYSTAGSLLQGQVEDLHGLILEVISARVHLLRSKQDVACILGKDCPGSGLSYVNIQICSLWLCRFFLITRKIIT